MSFALVVSTAIGLSALAGLAWLSHHPAALEQAADWPLLGPAAVWLHRVYVRPVSPSPPAGGEAEVIRLDRRGRRMPRLPRPREEYPHVWVLAATPVLAAPEAAARTLFTTQHISHLPQLERRGDWFRIWDRGREGWVFLDKYEEKPPLGNEPEPAKPLPPREPDSQRLAVALDLLGPAATQASLGGYRVLTDISEPTLLPFLDRLLPSLDRLYRERYGRQPLEQPRAALVLFAREAAYRRFQGIEKALVGLHPAGHNTRGIAALYAEGRGRREMASTVIHELAHLIGRRAIGPALPPWLDEGIADDFGGGQLAADGTLRPEILGGIRRLEERRLTLGGTYGSVEWVRQALDAGERLLPGVLELDWHAFVRTEKSPLHYAVAGLFVRYLVDGEGGRRAAAFREFLDRVAAGGEPSAAALRATLGEPWPVLEAGFGVWVRRRAEELGPTPPVPSAPLQ